MPAESSSPENPAVQFRRQFTDHLRRRHAAVYRLDPAGALDDGHNLIDSLFNRLREKQELQRHLSSLSPENPAASFTQSIDNLYLQWTFNAVFSPDNSLLSYSALCQDVTALIEEQNRLRAQLNEANTDPATGLPNVVRFRQEISRLEALDLPVMVLMADVNFLKEVNDTLGHDLGDQLLFTVATILDHSIRPSDLAVRLAPESPKPQQLEIGTSSHRVGGDEFACLLPGVAEEHLPLILDRINHVTDCLNGNTLPRDEAAKKLITRIKAVLASRGTDLAAILKVTRISFALGAAVAKTDPIGEPHPLISAALKKADADMYTQKAATKQFHSDEEVDTLLAKIK